MYNIKINDSKKDYYHDRVIVLKEQLALPHIDNKEVFNNYYLTLENNTKKDDQVYYKESIENYEANSIPNRLFTPYEVIIKTVITLNKDNLVSLYYDKYEYLGGAHGNTTRVGNTWDMVENKLLKLKDIVGSYKESQIFEYIKNEAKKRVDNKEAVYFDNLDKNIIDNFSEDNFYLDEKGVNIFYPLYSIAPYYVGIQVFNIPYIYFE